MPCSFIKFCQLILLIWKCCDRVKSCMSISGLKETKAKTSVLWSVLRIAKKNSAVSFTSIKMVFQILRHIWLEIICNTSSINTVRKPQTSDGQQIGRLFACYARKECTLLLTLHLKQRWRWWPKFHFLVFLSCPRSSDCGDSVRCDLMSDFWLCAALHYLNAWAETGYPFARKPPWAGGGGRGEGRGT